MSYHDAVHDLAQDAEQMEQVYQGAMETGETAAFKEAIARGQYEFPQGLFYGGERACWSTRTIQTHAASWMGSSERVLHVDFHSGLGKHGTYRLLINESPEASRWYDQAFGAECVESLV